MPPISILKPLKGTDPGMYESFRSHCLLNYPQYEILFGVSEAKDPALELVERLKIEFPEKEIRLCWLYPLRDLLGFFLWLASFSGRGFVWRGERYSFHKGGKIIAADRP